MSMYPREIVEAIKDRSDIVDLIGTYVSLKRAGSNYNGLCPFHSEKTPSFTVFPDNQSFFCFGCEAGGDAFTFIMRMENLDYKGSIEFLAKRSGVELPADGAQEQRGLTRKRVFEMNLIAARFWRDCLFDPVMGQDAMRYLTEKRGLSVPFIKHFGTSPKQFIIDLRIQRAKQMLAEGALSVSIISEKCGFSNPYHFCRLFKQRVGITPSEYRKANLIYEI